LGQPDKMVNTMFGNFSEESLQSFYASFEECAPGEKMTFGVCRKVDGSTQKQSSEEELAQKQAGKNKSSFENNKKVTVGGKEYGWAKANGKKVLVPWGSVAGEKKVGPKQPEAKPAEASKEKSAQAPAPSPREKMAQKANDPALSDHDRAVAGIALSVADRSAYKAGGGNAAAMRGMGSSTQQVIEQGKKNLDRMDQGRGRS